MLRLSPARPSRLASLLVGAAAAVAAFGPAPVPADDGRERGAEVRVSLGRSGELDVAPAGDLLAASDLRRGLGRWARLTLTNRAPAPVRFRLGARAASRELDGTLRFALRSGGRVLYSGALAGLRRGTRPLRLGPGRTAPVTLRVELARDARGHEGRSAQVTLEPRS